MRLNLQSYSFHSLITSYFDFMLPVRQEEILATLFEEDIWMIATV